MTLAFDFGGWRDDRLSAFETFLDAVLPGGEPFAEAMRYPLFSGGKRIRPLLCLAAFDAITDAKDLNLVLPMAAGVELIHTYSLVHDDLPCMDDDDERRGRPTVHKQFDEATAVLVGDALLTHAFRVLVNGEAVDVLADAAGHRGMIGGQVLDMGLAGPVETLERLTTLHELKTGRLIRAACHLGGMAASAPLDQLASLTRYGELVGLAFQLVDDVLDADEDAGADGPPSFVKLLGVDETLRRAHVAVSDACERVAYLPRPAALVELAKFTVERTV